MSQMRLAAPLRRQHILDGALPVFSEHGFHDTSMNEIAEAVGVTKPVIYQHFGSKRELFSSLIDTVGNDMVETVKTATRAASDGKAQTQRGFQAYFHWVDTHHDGFRLLFGGAARHDDEFSSQIRQITSSIASAVASMIMADVDNENQALIAHAVVGFAEGASRRLIDNNLEFDPEAIATVLSTLAWAGLRALTPTST
ncbi:MAG: TetR/AcrR family transcriptional regulator [Ilumatobacteraceae bacterium]|nr:TetR/AcrR family transcriptional regulator [Actinomycetota bacterium]